MRRHTLFLENSAHISIFVRLRGGAYRDTCNNSLSPSRTTAEHRGCFFNGCQTANQGLSFNRASIWTLKQGEKTSAKEVGVSNKGITTCCMILSFTYKVQAVFHIINDVLFCFIRKSVCLAFPVCLMKALHELTRLF